jgi:hypothetical protein
MPLGERFIASCFADMVPSRGNLRIEEESDESIIAQCLVTENGANVGKRSQFESAPKQIIGDLLPFPGGSR